MDYYISFALKNTCEYMNEFYYLSSINTKGAQKTIKL